MHILEDLSVLVLFHCLKFVFWINGKLCSCIECGLTLKHIRDMTRTYSQMQHTDKYSEHSSTIWPVWPNG